MCGDDEAVRNGGEAAKGTEGTRSAYIGLAQTAGVAEARSDRLSVEEFSPQTVSRPALALIRRQTRSERSGWPTAGVEPCSGVPCIGAWGRAYNQGAQGVCRHCRSRS